MHHGELGAESRRELESLRRRAYGRDADILDDRDALARLTALEERLREASAASDPPEAPTAPSTPSSPTVPSAAPRTASGTASAIPSSAVAAESPRARSSWHAGLITACGAVALVLGAFAATTSVGAALPAATPTPTPTPTPTAGDVPAEVRAFTEAEQTRVLFRIRHNSPLGSGGGVVDPGDAPRFPTDEPVRWVASIGRYYGTWAWIARTAEGGSCLLIQLESWSRTACKTLEEFRSSALLVTVPYLELSELHRPEHMIPTESLALWWRPERPIDVLVGPTPGVGP